MALEGKIVDFGVADILQLISQQQKTGVLIVERSNESVEVLFWNGMILTAYPSMQNENEELGSKLVKAGIINGEQLKKATDAREKNFKHLGEILIELDMLNKEVLEKILHNQIYDVFSEIFQWKDGSYAFRPRSIDLNEKVFSPLGLELIILDVLRMIDEWPDILKKVPSLSSVFRKTDRRLTDKDKEDISHEEIVVYKLVNGINTVDEIVDKSLLGNFSTAKNLMQLLDEGYIKLIPKKKAVKVDKKVKFRIDDNILITGCYGVLAVIVLVLLIVSPPDIKGAYRLFTEPLIPSTSKHSYIERSRLLKVKNALQIYFWENGGRYPENLKALVDARILNRREIKDSKGDMYYYKSEGGFYKLHQRNDM